MRHGTSPLAALLAFLIAGDLLGQDPPRAPVDIAFTVSDVEVRGLDRLDPPVRLSDALPLRPGSPYTDERLEATEDAIVAAFAERGRPYPVLEVGAELSWTERTAHVVAEVVDPGPPVRVLSVAVSAEGPLEEDVVRERVAFAPGDLFRPSRLERTRERLLMLPVVRDAAVTAPGLLVGDTALAVTVHVATVPRPRGPELQGGLSSTRCLELAGFWRDRYFLGGPRFLSLGAGGSNLLADRLGDRFPCASVGEGEVAEANYFLSGEIRHPRPGDPLTTVSGRAFLRRESAARAFVIRSVGGRVQVERVLRREIVVAIGYAPERTEVISADFYYCINFGACTDPEIRALTGRRWLAPAEGRVEWVPQRTRDARRRPLGDLEAPPPAFVVPAWRPSVRMTAAGAGQATGSDHAFGRVTLEAVASRPLGRRSEVVVRGRAGAATRGRAPLPPQVRFLTGGPYTIRGAEQNLLGPRVLVTGPEEAREMGCEPVPGGCPAGAVADPELVRERPRGGHLLVEANLELRLQVAPRIQVAGFVDYGLLQGERGPLGPETATRSRGSALAPGLGFRVSTPVGLLRLDVGYDPRGRTLLPLLGADPDGEELVFLGDVVWDPSGRGDPGALQRSLRRLQVGLAVGQPF